MVCNAGKPASEGSPMLAISPSRLHLRRLGSLARTESAAQPFAIGPASADNTTTTTQPQPQQHHCSTAIPATNLILSEPPLPNNPCALEGKRPPPPCRNSSDRYIPPHTVHSEPPSLTQLFPPDPSRLLTRMAPCRRRHRPTPSRPPGLLHRPHPHGQAQTHLRP